MRSLFLFSANLRLCQGLRPWQSLTPLGSCSISVSSPCSSVFNLFSRLTVPPAYEYLLAKRLIFESYYSQAMSFPSHSNPYFQKELSVTSILKFNWHFLLVYSLIFILYFIGNSLLLEMLSSLWFCNISFPAYRHSSENTFFVLSTPSSFSSPYAFLTLHAFPRQGY